ncbi:MAG: YbaK/EbsC family protein [Oscillospiraceae bacterium]|nr:YbaK/EbsC family protein [Oscillospiraceae bacterium]
MDNKAVQYFKEIGLGNRIREFEHSSATVALAAQVLGCEEKQIAKTLAFLAPGPILVVCGGASRVDNAKFRQTFGCKAKMIPAEDVEQLVGYPAGGVCPFCVNSGVTVYLDESLKELDTWYPACGARNNAVVLSLEELERFSNAVKWVDITKEQ